jgi:hypothetical protein
MKVFNTSKGLSYSKGLLLSVIHSLFPFYSTSEVILVQYKQLLQKYCTESESSIISCFWFAQVVVLFPTQIGSRVEVSMSLSSVLSP